MRMTRPVLHGVLALGLFAFSSCARSVASKPTASPSTAATSEAHDDGSTQDDPPAKPTAHPGVAHSGNIDLTVLGPTGECAITRDSSGGTRLWAALDGSAEPQLVPLQGPRSLGVAKHTEDGSFTVFGVESSGGARLLSITADGQSKELAAFPPFDPILEALVLPGGKHALALMKDGSIRGYDRSGKEVLRFDERRFQPYQLRLGADGKHLMAMVKLDRSTGDFRAEAQRLSLDLDAAKPAIKRVGVPHIIRSAQDFDPTLVAVSPDASELTVVDRSDGSNKWKLQVYDLTKDQEPRTVEVDVRNHMVPRIGYVQEGQVLVSSNEGSLSWLLDLENGETRARASIPQDFNHQGRVLAVGPDRQLVGYGNFLFVHDIAARRHRFLGYAANQGSSVALSPKGTHVAWAFSQGPIYVEAIDDKDGGELAKVDPELNNFGLHVGFVDEEKLVVVDSMGSAALLQWRTGERLDSAGVMANVRDVQFDPTQGLVLIERHTNDAWLYEVDDANAFVGPYIVADGVFRSSLLRPKPPSDLVLWTMNPDNEIHQYTLEELRADITKQELEAMAKPLKSGVAAPLAVDHLRRRYGVKWDGSNMVLFVEGENEKETRTKTMPSGDVAQIFPSPDGERFLVTFNRSGSASLAMYELETMESAWSYSSGAFASDVSWSADGQRIALATATGAIVLDAPSGKPVAKRCGIQFQSLGAPPSNAFSSPNQRSICEL